MIRLAAKIPTYCILSVYAAMMILPAFHHHEEHFCENNPSQGVSIFEIKDSHHLIHEKCKICHQIASRTNIVVFSSFNEIPRQLTSIYSLDQRTHIPFIQQSSETRRGPPSFS